MSTWLTAWRNRDRRPAAGPVMELLVVAGADAGNQFTLEGDEILMGRGQPESGQTDVIRLQDRSISRRQAWIRRDADGATIEHVPTALNPTLVNGVAVQRTRLAVGDRIEMGRVAVDVRARAGVNLSGFTEIMEDAAREATQTGVDVRDGPTAPIARRNDPDAASTWRGEGESTVSGSGTSRDVTEEATDVRPMEVELGRLTVLRGADAAMGSRFPIPMGGIRIGRGDDAEVQIVERGVSRLHAEIRLEGREIVLVQRSKTNPTLVNGFPVVDRIQIRSGDEIQLADRVALGVQLFVGGGDGEDADSLSGSGLYRTMKHKIEVEREIEDFNVMGSFLDVDVVSSRAMKGGGEKAEHIIVSFDRFRTYVGRICAEWNGQILNSNGDELMCFFESAEDAVRAGSAILARLDAFNREQNLLSRDFRFRLGLHTGLSLVDLDAGIAYSEILDIAGHIQKQAEPNTLLLSQPTLDSLDGAAPVSQVGELTGGGGPLYRLDGPLPAAFGDPREREDSSVV